MVASPAGPSRSQPGDVPPHELVVSAARLRRLADVWINEPALALDTEFVRTRTFFARLGLIQVGWPGGCALIDCVELRDLAPLGEVLAASSVVKVLHSPAEDLEVFLQVFEVLPQPLFDTQLAASLVGKGSFPGYQRLVRDLFGVELAKEQQRSDWTKRPLGEDQLAYAASDVHFLLPAYGELSGDLRSLGREAWAREEFAKLIATAREKNDPRVVFERLRRASMRPPEAGVLWSLVEWRETEARRRDIPRGFVLKDDVLLQLSRRRPKTMEDLRAIEALGEGVRRRVGRELLKLVSDASPLATDGESRSTTDKAKLRLIRACAAKEAEELQVPEELLLTKRDAQRMAGRGSEPPEAALRELGGWRAEVLGEPMRALWRTWSSKA
jgi:ribonuclease D